MAMRPETYMDNGDDGHVVEVVAELVPDGKVGDYIVRADPTNTWASLWKVVPVDKYGSPLSEPDGQIVSTIGKYKFHISVKPHKQAALKAALTTNA